MYTHIAFSMTAMVRCFVLVFVIVSVSHSVLAEGTGSDISDVLNEFRQRIESLEARDAAKDVKIAELESEISSLKLEMAEMDSVHKQKESRLQGHIDRLEKSIEQSFDDIGDEQTDPDTGKTETDSYLSSPTTPNRIRRQNTSIRKNRAISETEVAFYATHTNHYIHHLGNNQVLLFQQAITNVGQAYNNNTGAFVAPVDGTYVFHATVRGIDVDNHTNARAHFDVDGTAYSEIFFSNNDQSSQMLVINLTTGQAVSVRNKYQDVGFAGMHFSSFSGFLLYQTIPSGGTIVGK